MNEETPRRRKQWIIPCLVVAVVFWTVVAALVIPIFARAHRAFEKTLCIGNLQQIGRAIDMYESDWDDCLPPLSTNKQRASKGKGWFDLIAPYAPNKYAIAECPSAKGRLTYSFNCRLSGISYEKIKRPPEDVPLIFESVNDLPENNNLNGDSVCRPAAEKLPVTGSYVIWPEDTYRLRRDWPTWARPNHEDATMVVMADGHARVRRTGSTPYVPSLLPK